MKRVVLPTKVIPNHPVVVTEALAKEFDSPASLRPFLRGRPFNTLILRVLQYNQLCTLQGSNLRPYACEAYALAN